MDCFSYNLLNKTWIYHKIYHIDINYANTSRKKIGKFFKALQFLYVF